MRRKFKSLSLILAISLAVTIVVSVQIAKEGVYNVYSKAELDGYGNTDIIISNPTSDAGLFSINITDQVKQIETTFLNQIEYISPTIRHLLPVYIPETKEFERMVFVNGIDPTLDRYKSFTNINGSLMDLEVIFANNTDNNSIISSSMANDLRLEINDIFITTVPNGMGNYSQIELTITGIYDDTLGRGIEGVFPPFTSSYQVYTDLTYLQMFHHQSLRNHINQIDISLKSEFIDRRVEVFDAGKNSFPGKNNVEKILEELIDLIQPDLSTVSIRSPRLDLLSSIDIRLEQFTITLDIFVILLNVTSLLLIVNVQNMSVDDRKYQTAVLRALGNSRKTIIRIFIYEALILGLLGSLIAIFLGLYLGEWIQNTINEIFELSGIEPVIKVENIIVAVIFGIFLSTITAILPTLKVAKMPVNEALRGIDSKSTSDHDKKILYFGLSLSLLSLFSLISLGEFWKSESLSTFSDQILVTILLELFLTGIFLALSKLVNQRLSLTLWGLSFIILASYNMTNNYEYVSNPPLVAIVDWFMVMMYSTIIGAIIIVAVNIDILLKGLERFLFLFIGLRATIQVSVAQLLSQRFRLILIFSIITIIMMIGMFFGTLAQTEGVGMVNQFEWRSDGVNIVVDVQVPIPGIKEALENIENVDHVYGFKKAAYPFYNDDPSSDYFDPVQDTKLYKSLVEIPENTLKPNGVWDEESLVLSFLDVDDQQQYEFTDSMTQTEIKELSKTILDDFFENPTIDKPVIHTDTNENEIRGELQTGYNVIGGLTVGFVDKQYLDRMLYLPNNNSHIKIGYVGGVVDMMGDTLGFGSVSLVTENLANDLDVFQDLKHPNLFLIKTSADYFDDASNKLIANEIETTLNNLIPGENPLCSGSSNCILIGASTRIVHNQYIEFFKLSSQTWAFFSLFSFFALIIGVLGLIIIAVRSVSERTREIGMRRAIGFSRAAVVGTLALELFVVVIMGIIVGIIDSVITLNFFARISYKTAPVYPIKDIITNITILFFSSLIAGIIPGYRAAKIPPSQALRYTG